MDQIKEYKKNLENNYNTHFKMLKETEAQIIELQTKANEINMHLSKIKGAFEAAEFIEKSIDERTCSCEATEEEVKN